MKPEGGSNAIALIGPMPPHRGGIAQYGLRLHQALRNRLDATTFAFKRQYPAWLYPGESDIDPGSERILDGNVRYIIDSLNPLTWFRAAEEIAALRPTAAVMQWWTVFWWPAFALIAIRLRGKGIPVILLCHNVVDHETSSWKEWLSTSILSLASGFIVHSNEHRDLLAARFVGRPIMQAAIPAYADHPQPSRKLAKRGRLDLLFFGFLRPYKGLDVLLDALELLDDREIYLTVAGEAWEDCAATVERMRKAAKDNLELHLEFVPADLAAALFDRADAVVLPYERASGSAVVALAYNFDKPVIASRVGGLLDAVVEGETGFFFSPGNPRELADILSALDRPRLQELAHGVASYRSSHGWDRFAEAVDDLAGQVGGDKNARSRP
ncbi:glycosyltransferase [Luteimonas sp. SX5]|uniref:Glycosyltransferase n=1 Tax=Luteimonas galliterrae TaxID=2940486 RepID=A0ABT0MIX5_9GAMM|nr:glycosyltransferase [Luteimonas galliterrae]MCL1634628.1 glycosyltransferase [Luteimonas galliterrae]